MLSTRAILRASSSPLRPSRAVQQFILGDSSVRSGLNPTPVCFRTYASKASKSKGKPDPKAEKADRRSKASLVTDREQGARGPRVTSSDKLIPGSEQALVGEAQEEYEKTDARMKSAVDWFRRECAAMEMHGSGRVTPDVLKPVRVVLPESDGVPCGLQEVATVGVRDGTTILVTVFAESSLKHVEKAIYAADIPHVVPQKVDNRTLKIPMPKPTVESKNVLYKKASSVAEETRVQLRRHEQAAVKKGKYEKRSIELAEFHDLLSRQLKDVELVLAELKKNLGVSGK